MCQVTLTDHTPTSAALRRLPPMRTRVASIAVLLERHVLILHDDAIVADDPLPVPVPNAIDDLMHRGPRSVALSHFAVLALPSGIARPGLNLQSPKLLG